MSRQFFSEAVTGDTLVSYWPIFFLSLVTGQLTTPEVFAKVNFCQCPCMYNMYQFYLKRVMQSSKLTHLPPSLCNSQQLQ